MPFTTVAFRSLGISFSPYLCLSSSRLGYMKTRAAPSQSHLRCDSQPPERRHSWASPCSWCSSLAELLRSLRRIRPSPRRLPTTSPSPPAPTSTMSGSFSYHYSLVEKSSKSATPIYFYRRIWLSTDCAIPTGGFLKKTATRNRISSGGSLRKPPVKIHDL
jgi:hypothetical protein